MAAMGDFLPARLAAAILQMRPFEMCSDLIGSQFWRSAAVGFSGVIAFRSHMSV